MPATNSVNIPCDWRGAFNLSADRRGNFGYLLEWSGLGGLVLAKDIVIWNPVWGTNHRVLTDATIPCIGVFEQFAFDGDEGDPLRIDCWVSKDNQTNIRAKLARDLVNTKVKARWALVQYDESAKSWYDAVELLSPTRIDAAINTVDGELKVSVDGAATPLGDNLNIEVFRFQFQLIPTGGKKSQIQFAMGPTQRIVRQWAEA